jgi:hypothetical protein
MSKILLLQIKIVETRQNLKNPQKLLYKSKKQKILFSLFVPIALMLIKHKKLKKNQNSNFKIWDLSTCKTIVHCSPRAFNVSGPIDTRPV